MPDAALIPRFSPAIPPRAGEGGGIGDIGDIGVLIREERRRQRLTLQDLASRAGCSRSYLSQIENRRVGPPADELLARLEDVLGLAPGMLLALARAQRRHRELSALGALRADVLRLQHTLQRVRACVPDSSAAAPLIDEALAGSISARDGAAPNPTPTG